jgi:hypothetical protein
VAASVIRRTMVKGRIRDALECLGSIVGLSTKGLLGCSFSDARLKVETRVTLRSSVAGTVIIAS